MLEIDAALYSDYHDQQSKGNASGVGNWRSHTLIKCNNCQKLMGHHKQSLSAICNTCASKVKKGANNV